MRGTSEGLAAPVALVDLLPGIYQDDEFTRQFTGGFDDVLATVFATLDCLEVYVDPWLAPEDFLGWLSGWVGVTIDEGWPEDRTRALIAGIAELYRWRGTVRGLRAELEIYTGGIVDISETGGTAWSRRPGAALPGDDVPRLAVRVIVDDPARINAGTVDRMIAAAKPAHVAHLLEVVGATDGGGQ
ncbi:MAG: phage tail protein [Ilumatobacteraceae bacterium]